MNIKEALQFGKLTLQAAETEEIDKDVIEFVKIAVKAIEKQISKKTNYE